MWHFWFSHFKVRYLKNAAGMVCGWHGKYKVQSPTDDHCRQRLIYKPNISIKIYLIVTFDIIYF